MRRHAPVALLAVAAGCGGGGGGAGAPPPHPATTGGVAVVRSWAETLRQGDVAGAARLFTVPARVQNGTPLLVLRSRGAVRAFNRALPCGARLLRATPHHGYVIAEFRLVDRTGPGATHPCQGRGGEAATAFKIVHGRIAEWRRVPTPGETVPPADTNPT